jgi:hypothetical protein
MVGECLAELGLQRGIDHRWCVKQSQQRRGLSGSLPRGGASHAWVAWCVTICFSSCAVTCVFVVCACVSVCRSPAIASQHVCSCVIIVRVVFVVAIN